MSLLNTPIVLAAVLASAVLAAGCGERKPEKSAAETAAARVNKDTISLAQLNLVLQQQRQLRPEQADAASRQLLERLIDQTLLAQKAQGDKLDQDPKVQQQLEAARREVIARAYVDKLGEGAAKPSPEEVRRYFEDKPALFRERRIYQLQELSIEARSDQIGPLRERLSATKTIGEFVEYLKANDIRFAANQAVRAAEQLPLPALESLSRMKDGQAHVTQTPTGLQVLVLASSRSQPVGEEQARTAIELFLLNERKRKRVEDELKVMRGAAEVEYFGRFADGQKGGSGTAASAPGASGLPDAAPGSTK